MKIPEILFEDEDIIVCHKPAGMATQTRKLGQQDMESYLKNYRAKKKESPYIGIVHRLDQPVEGVMVFAKNPKAAADLSKQVQNRLIGKHYIAGCVGDSSENFGGNSSGRPDAICQPNVTYGTLTDYILTDKKNNVSKIVPEGTAQAKKAVLDYRIIEPEEGACGLTYFDITLHTGRQHQIRLQLSNMGYSIAGDKKYGSDVSIAASRELLLCSYKIEFVHPGTGKQMAFQVEPGFLR